MKFDRLGLLAIGALAFGLYACAPEPNDKRNNGGEGGDSSGGSGGGGASGGTGGARTGGSGGSSSGGSGGSASGGSGGSSTGGSGGSSTGGSGGSSTGGSGGSSMGGTGGNTPRDGGTDTGGNTNRDMGGGGDAAGGTKVPVAVANILKAKCAAACHNGEWQDAAKAYTRLLGTATGACANMKRMTAGDGANSLVIKKMLGTAGCGGKMPRVNNADCTGTACVPMADIMTIQTWIQMGAKPE